MTECMGWRGSSGHRDFVDGGLSITLSGDCKDGRRTYNPFKAPATVVALAYELPAAKRLKPIGGPADAN